MINNLLILGSLIAIGIFLFLMYQKSKLNKTIVIEDDFSSIDKVLEAVKIEMVEIIKEDFSTSLTELEFNAMYKRKARINQALRNCVYGIDQAKVIVMELIRGFIESKVSADRVSELLGLEDGMEPSDQTKFEILMYRYKKQHGKKALSEWINKYNLADPRRATDSTRATDIGYYITVEDLHQSYENENIILSDLEKIDILTVLVYQLYKGFGILDTLREMDINGFNCGTSGSILTNVTKQREGNFQANRSTWLYFNGQYIHLRFMDFGTEAELKRIIQLIVRYGNPAPLTAKKGYLVNTMYDKSRVLALRPPASEYWAVFVRKFSLSDVSPTALIKKDYNTGSEIPIQLLEYLMRGMVTCGFTGRQGSGKTTMMSSVVRFIDPRYTIRVLEMAPELYLRELYPTRNILSVQETSTVSAAELQDALKKSDAAVSMAGEVATDDVAARMIQLGQVASLFTIFSHHANTAKDLVFALRNSLVNAGGFSNMETAERQVTDVVKIDVHLDYTADGKRYIDRISEIIPLEENVPYPEYDITDRQGSMDRIEQEYYVRRTDRVSFVTRDILKYDLKNHTYVTVNRISSKLEEYMRKNLGELCEDFDRFTYENWSMRVDEVDHLFEAMKGYLEEDSKKENERMQEELEALKQGKTLAKNEGVDIVSSTISEPTTEIGISEEELNDMEIMFNFFDGDAEA